MSFRGDLEYRLLNTAVINQRRREIYLVAHPFNKGNSYSRAKRGKREDIGEDYFRSSWEANVARYLDLLIDRGVIQHWWYEPVRFYFDGIKSGVMSYLPDFMVVMPDDTVEFIEVKGWMDPKSKTKIRRLKKYHPLIVLSVIGPKEYNAIKEHEAHNIPEWEHRKR